MNSQINYIKSKLPLTITATNWKEPVLHLSGANWKFNAMTEWRIIPKDKAIVGCYDKELTSKVEALKSLQIVNIESQSKYLFDPVFILENGAVLEIFSSSTAPETWTLHFNDDGVFLESHER